MSDHIPETVLIKILLGLPVKSLVRFTLVCKAWQAFITSPDFISIHLNKFQYFDYNNFSIASGRCRIGGGDDDDDSSSSSLMIRYYLNEECYQLRPNNNDYRFISQYCEFNFPENLKSRQGFYQIVGTCNGIICLCDSLFGNFSTSPVILWNPSIQKDIVLPLPVVEPSSKCFVLGFGYDVHGDDYKVVRIRYRPGIIRKPVEADIFSLKNKRWRIAKDVIFRGYINDVGQSQVYFNGIVHWMGYQEKGNGDLENSILGFDCSDNEFIETILPICLADFKLNPNLHMIITHEGCLGMISYNETHWKIWELKEYGSAESWTQLFSFDWTKVYDVPLNRGMTKLIGFRKTGELLITIMVKDSRDRDVDHVKLGKLVSYNPNDDRITLLLPEISGRMDSFYVLDYVESLCLLDYTSLYPAYEGEIIRSTVLPAVEEDENEWDYEDSSMEELHGFVKFKKLKLDCDDENENDDDDENNDDDDDDGGMGKDNFDMKEAEAGTGISFEFGGKLDYVDEFLTKEKLEKFNLEFEAKNNINNGDDADVCKKEEVNVPTNNNQSDDDEDDDMQEVEDSWILI